MKKDETVIKRVCVLAAMTPVDNGHVEKYEIVLQVSRSKTSCCHYQ